jgi:iron complex outermembrane receptor protein
MGGVVVATALSMFAFGAEAPAAAHATIPPRELAVAAKSYQIPAGSIAVALNRLAEANGVQIVYRAQLTRYVKTQGLSGSYAMEDALGMLLAGTGLTYRLSGNGKAVSIILAQNDTGAQSDAGGLTLPTVEVTATQGGGAGGGQGTGDGSYGGAGPGQDPYNTSYVLPDSSTGTKTDTPVMDTPLNVQTVTQQVIQDQQAITLEQALQNVSGVTVAGGGGSGAGSAYNQLVVRGFPTSTIYRNGFRLDTGNGLSEVDGISTTQLANVASIDVLKGPAAVLYGLLEPGGLINIVTKEPLNAPYYSVQQQLGSFANYRTSIDATGPLNPEGSLLYRMDLSYQNNDAPLGSPYDFDYAKNTFFAPVVKWNIDGATWVKLEAQYNETHQNLDYTAVPLFNGVFVPVPRNVNYGGPSPDRQTQIFTALTWSHQFDNDWSVKQQLAYYRGAVDQNITFPFTIGDFGNGPQFLNFTEPTFSTETVFSGNVDITGHFNTFGAKHTLLLGGDVYDLQTSIINFGNPLSVTNVWNPVLPPTPFGSQALTPAFASAFNQETAGLYLQDQIQLPYNFFLMVGARYQYIGQTLATGVTNDDLIQQGQPLATSALTPRFGLLWRPESWVSFYGAYAEGFGPNSGEIYPGIAVPPTGAHDLEAGVKFEFFGGKLRITADAYDLTETNIPTTDPQHPNFDIVTGAARSKGPELDIQGTLLPGWDVIAAFTNQDVKVTQSNTGSVGQFFPNTPRNLGSFWTTYEFQDDMWNLKGVKIGGGVVYHGSEPVAVYGSEDFQGASSMTGAYATVNLMAAYSFKCNGVKLTAQLNVTNLLNATYFTSEFVPGTPAPVPGYTIGYRVYGAPQAFLGSLKAEF